MTGDLLNFCFSQAVKRQARQPVGPRQTLHESHPDRAPGSGIGPQQAGSRQEINRLLADKYCLVNFMMITNGICAVKKEVQDSGLFEIALTQFNPADVYLSR